MEEIKSLIISKFGENAIEAELNTNMQTTWQVPVNLLHDICVLLHTHEQTYMDYLTCVTGIDNGPEKATMEVIYHLYSIPYEKQVILKVVVPRGDAENLPQVPSVTNIWRGADWHEREAYDMLGIVFTNHPDLRRILMPNDWEGYPLRKDYQEQETYHGIKVKY